MGQWCGAVEGLVVSPDFWRDKRVFVTGHTGFKGGWLSLWLQSLGARVCGYSLPAPTEPNLFGVAEIESGMTSLTGDIRDRQHLTKELQAWQPEIVFHMAAQPLVRESYTDPATTYETNVMGTVNLLEAVRSTAGVACVIIVTSDKCYENREQIWGYRENEPMGGHDPYSNSKGCAELVTASYRRAFFQHSDQSANVASVRAGNVIGGGDWAGDRLIPDMIRAFQCNKPAMIRSPKAVRPWQHVLEPLSGYLLLAEKLFSQAELATGWNFGPANQDAKPVEWVANFVCELWGDNAQWRYDCNDHPHEAGILRLDCSKANQLLGWETKLHLPEALELTTRWYKAYTDRADMRDYCLHQLDRYTGAETCG